jgi:hypothetical protein
MLLDFSELSTEKVTGRLKAVDNHEQLPPSEPVTIGGKLLFTKEQWLARQREQKKGEASGSSALGLSSGCKRRPRKWDKTHGGAPGGADGERKATRDDTYNNYGRTGHRGKDCRQVKRGGQAHVAQVQEGDEPALFFVHGSIELHSSPAPATAALLHLDEPWAHVFLSNESDGDKIDRWYLDIGTTYHMTGRREFFSELDSGVRGSVKFGDASAMEIKGVSSVVFTTKTGEHWLLTSVYYIPALRNSIISLGQLDENGSRVKIEHGLLCI